MRERKRRMEVYSFFDCEGISRQLEKMAAKGWMIEEITNFYWTYRRTEPKEVKFAVSYYPKASEFDPKPTEDQKIFHEFCAHTGWKLACTSAQLQIFYNERENPTPIETEPILEVESIHASAKRSFLPAYGLLALLCVFMGGLFITSLLREPISQLSSPENLFSGVSFTVLAILCVVEIFCYVYWHERAKRAAWQGEFLRPLSTSGFQKGIMLMVFLGLLYWLVNTVFFGGKLQRWIGIFTCFYMPALLILVNGTKRLLKRRGVSRGVNRTLTILTSFVLAYGMLGLLLFATIRLYSTGFFEEEKAETYEYNGMTWEFRQDELPLTLGDLLEADTGDYIREQSRNASFLLGELVAREHPRFDAAGYEERPYLEYTLVLVKLPALYEFCRDSLLREPEDSLPVWELHYEAQEAAPWGADEAYRLRDSDSGYWNKYLLCYDGMLVEIIFSWEPTEEQMGIVGERLLIY